MKRLVRRIVCECPSCGHKIASIMEEGSVQYKVCDKCLDIIPPTKKERERNKRKKVISSKWK